MAFKALEKVIRRIYNLMKYYIVFRMLSSLCYDTGNGSYYLYRRRRKQAQLSLISIITNDILSLTAISVF